MNKAILIGNVGKDPEVKYYEADQAVATVRLATSEKGYTLPNGTRVPDRTDWHTLVFFRRLAKVVEAYVHKGDKIYVDGKLQYRTVTDRKGMERTVTEIIVDNLELLTPKSAQATPTPAAQQPAPAQPTAPAQEAPEASAPEEIIPF